MPKGDRLYRIASSREIFDEFLLSQQLNTDFFDKPFCKLDGVQKAFLQLCNYFYSIIKNYGHTEEFQRVDFYELIQSRQRLRNFIDRINSKNKSKK